jgi:hypothetical protein
MYTPQQRQENLASLYTIENGRLRLKSLFDKIAVPARVEVDSDPGYRFVDPHEFVVTIDCANKKVPDLLGLLARLQDFSGMPLVLNPDSTQATNQSMPEDDCQPQMRATLFLQQGISDLLGHIISEGLKRPDRVVGLVLDNFGYPDEF